MRFLTRAADKVWMRKGVILNPRCKDLGNPFGSADRTCLGFRHTGEQNAARLERLAEATVHTPSFAGRLEYKRAGRCVGQAAGPLS